MRRRGLRCVTPGLPVSAGQPHEAAADEIERRTTVTRRAGIPEIGAREPGVAAGSVGILPERAVLATLGDDGAGCETSRYGSRTDLIDGMGCRRRCF